MKPDAPADNHRNEQRRERLQATSLTAWDLHRTREGAARDARTRLMTMKTHERLRLLAEAELGVPKHQRSFLKHGREGEPGVLMIHDTMQTPADYVPLGRTLNDAGLTVHGLLLADLGHGVTDRPEARWRATVQRARVGYQLLSETCADVVVVGAGFGAVLALHLADREKVAGLVLLAPALAPRVSLGIKLLQRFNLLHLPPVRRRLGPMVDAMDGMHQAQNLAGKLRVPMFGVHCDDDEVASPESLRILQKKAGDRGRFRVFPEGGHEVLAAHGADGLEKDILEFIRRR